MIQDKVQNLQSINVHKGTDFWTHDAIVHEDVIGRINEPLVLVTDRGDRFVPATIVYIKDTNGDRQYKNQKYRRDLIDYFRDLHKLGELGLEKYRIYDPVAEVNMVALPLDGSKIIKADNSFEEIISGKGKLSMSMLRLTSYFPNVNFGVIGSMQLGLDGDDSDIDLVVYGGKDYFDVVNQLKSKEVQDKLEVDFQDQNRIDLNALKYQKRYSISFSRAQEISKLRARFSIKLENGGEIKMGINSCFNKGEYDGVTILGAEKIKKASVEGKIVDIINSCSFPREYVVKNGTEKIKIASHHWGHQLLGGLGDRIRVQGNFRRSRGEDILFLEDDKICFEKI